MTNQPNQSFSCSIPLSGGARNVVLDFFQYWNHISGYWEINIADGSSDTPLITGLPLLPGLPPAQNLIRAFGYMDIGAAYVVPITNPAPVSPGVDSWGVDYVLLWGDQGELEAITG